METSRKSMAAVWIVAIVFFMELLDTTIINTSLPQIATSFGVPTISIKLAITSYLITLAVFIPISGWMADKYGTRKIFTSAILIFTVSSFFCGISTSLYELALFRALQGIGGAMMTPVGRLIIIRSFQPTELVRIMGYITIPALFGPIIGPLLGGFITTYYSWHWIFFINIPVGIVCFLLSQKFVQNEKSLTSKPLDIKGFFLCAFALSFISFSFENISEHFFSKTLLIIIIILGFLLLSIYFFHAKKIKYPLLDLNLFKINSFLIANILLILSLLSMGGVNFLLPILFQSQFGLTPIQSGLMTFPIAVGALVMRPCVPKIIQTLGYKKTLIINPVLCSINLLFFTFINESNPLQIGFIGFAFGAWYALQFSTSNILGYTKINSNDKSMATSLQSTTQQFGMSLGICFSALILNTFLSLSEAHLGNFNETKDVVFSFHNCFIIMASLCLLNSLVALILKPEKGIKTNVNANGRKDSKQQEKTA